MNYNPEFEFSEHNIKADELYPVILQDSRSHKVFRLVTMNLECIQKTVRSGEIWIYHVQDKIPSRITGFGEISQIRWNKHDRSFLISVDVQIHNPIPDIGYAYPVVEDSEQSEQISQVGILTEVFDVIMERKKLQPEQSYVAKKMNEGIDRILKKIGEEAGEVIIAAKNAAPEEISFEMADLIFHMWLVLGFYDMSPEDVYAKLVERRK